jgi:hypothetical protein
MKDPFSNPKEEETPQKTAKGPYRNKNPEAFPLPPQIFPLAKRSTEIPGCQGNSVGHICGHRGNANRDEGRKHNKGAPPGKRINESGEN